MAACDEIQLLLGPFDDGELEPHEMEDVAFHVVGCGGCKAALADYRALGVGLRDLATAPALDHFTDEVLARLPQRRVRFRDRIGLVSDWLDRLGAVVQVAGIAAATAVLTILATPYVQHYFAPSNSSPSALTASVEQPKVATPAIADSAANVTNVADDSTPDEQVAVRDEGELMSQIGGGEGPSMAVWDEPRSGTTVVWVPDQR